MDVAFLINHYFKGGEGVSIDVFDAQSLNNVYQKVVGVLTSHLDIEVSVLQALSYCFYEILDNVHIHSGKPLGTAITEYNAKKQSVKILVADDGMGIKASLAENSAYANISEPDAIKLAIQDSVTDGKGMGFGLYATSRLMNNIGIELIIHSGDHKLIYNKDGETIVKNGHWQGTIVYLELKTSCDIDPNDVVANRTDAESEYNEAFVESEDLETLW